MLAPRLAQLADYPLTRAQAAIWFAQQIEPTNPIYNVGEYLEIHGAIDGERFEAALNEVIQETEALQLRFVERGGSPRQLIDASSDWHLRIVDVSREPNPRAAAEALMAVDLNTPLDLMRDRLFAFDLFRCAADRFLWYLRFHHILIDGFAASLLVKRVADVYTALASGEPYGRSPLLSFRTLLEEELRYRASAQYTHDREYWIQRFADGPEPVSLSSRPRTRPHGFLRHTAFLAPTVVGTLHDTARSLGATLPQLITALTSTYLSRLIGTDDVPVEVVVTARVGALARLSTGMTSNILPLRLNLQPEITVSDVIQQVAAQMRRMLRHQRYRGEDLRRDLGLRTDDRRLFGPLVNIMPFDYGLEFGGHRATVHNLSNGPVDDLAIVVYDRSDTRPLRIDFDANPALYSAEELADHHHRFLHLLSSGVHGGERISNIDLLRADEREQILTAWNATAQPVPATTLAALLEGQAAQSPDAIAVIGEDEALSYRAFHHRANQLAHQLIGAGVGPEQLVAVALPRSIDLVVALVAIVKTGAAYLPLDPTLPPARLGSMLADAAPTLLLMTRVAAPSVSFDLCRQWRLDDPATIAALAQAPVTPPTDADRTAPLRAAHPAYVIYTSGSTGTPKGAINTHAAIVNRLLWMQAEYRLEADDRVLQKTPASFDVSVWEFFWPLLAGATLVVAKAGGHHDPAYLAGLIQAARITTIHFVPSMLEAFLAEPAAAQCDGLRRVICSGEALSAELAQQFATTLPSTVALHNLYGPTEAAVDVSAWACDRDDESTAIPIGRPIWNTRLYVLDGSLQPVPAGVAGEVYIGGVGLARGYLQRPALTAMRFVADPWGEPGTRMYRTGDLARWRRDGAVEYLGRTDFQVKLRGFRIELGEIEATLRRHPSVAQAVVVARAGTSSEMQLVGYVVPTPGAMADAGILRAHLAETLPDYMVPAPAQHRCPAVALPP